MKTKLLLISANLVFLASCAVKPHKNIELADFVLQEESGQFGYRTAWSKVLNEPLQNKEPESAREDFLFCKKEIREQFIKKVEPSAVMKLAFVVECMSTKGWYWRAVPYGYVSGL